MKTKPTALVFSIEESKSFPVEFTGTLVKLLHEQVYQQVWETLMETLEALKAPDEAKRLVNDLEALTLYYEIFSRQSENPTTDAHSDVMDVILQSVQDVADIGGEFEGRRRKGTFLEMIMTAKSEE